MTSTVASAHLNSENPPPAREDQSWTWATVEAAVDGIVTIDESGIIHYINPSAQRMFGYAAEEVVGKSINALMPAPYDEEHDAYIKQYVETGQKRIIGIGREAEAKRKDGTVFPVHLAVTEVWAGTKRLFAGIIHDVTEQKKSQVEKDRLLHELNRRNKEINCLYRVGEAVRSAEVWEAVLEDVAEFVHSTISDPAVAGIRISIDGRDYTSRQFQDTPWMLTSEIVTSKRTRGTLDVFLLQERAHLDSQRIRRENRNLMDAVVALLSESMERKEAEAKVINASKLASIGELAAGVGHEINNPINGVINCMDILIKQSEAGSEVRKFSELARAEAERIATIVRNLLTFSRQENEQYSMARLSDIVEGVLNLCGKKLANSNIELQVHVPEDLPMLNCRSEQLQQVVMNLIINAMHALDERYPTSDPNKKILIEGEVTGIGDEACLRLTVRDNGIGIAPAHVERIFDPFFTTKGRDRGTGLGLSVSDGIVKAHGGTISVESRLEEYTQFQVDLPLRENRLVEPNDGKSAAKAD
ncbi:MAG: PAS domain S-box protein [Candidatus Hydrogenedentes bacterium]|nr:PAS domain S-box protein [Candidatus Hydrogenedentota bacterium]